MQVLLFCAAVAIPAFTWTQGLGNGWVIKKNVTAVENGFGILAVVVPASQANLPLGVTDTETLEFVEGVVRDFNSNGVADSEQRYSFPLRQAVFVLVPRIENPNPHILGHSSQNNVPHRIFLEFMDEFGCLYGRPEDMKHDSSGKLIIDLLAGPCRADR